MTRQSSSRPLVSWDLGTGERAIRSDVDETGRERRERKLLAVLERDYEAAARASGEWLKCGPGCSDCCFGPFPITRLDVRRLRLGLGRLEDEDPAAARGIRRRAERAVAKLVPGFPGDPRTGRLQPDEQALDRYFALHTRLACPALEPSSGRCALYESRPVSCRTYGPPLRFGSVDAPHCGLCFEGAGDEIVERCRYEPDREGLERELLADEGAPPGEEWETLIAFALAGPTSGTDARHTRA